MDIVPVATLAIIGGVFTLAFKHPTSFAKLRNTFFWFLGLASAFEAGIVIGTTYGRSGERSLDGPYAVAVMVLMAVGIAMLIADWLAPPPK